MDVLDRADLPFPHSLPEFQRLFPDDAACAAYLEKARWGDGFACPHCGTAGEPFHFENRPGVWTHPGKVEAPYTVCIASASNLTGLVKSSVECRRTGL